MKEQCTMLESMQASRVKENATIEARFNQSRIKIASLREQVACLEQCLKQTECERDELVIFYSASTVIYYYSCIFILVWLTSYVLIEPSTA
jgi:hypothetical protein